MANAFINTLRHMNLFDPDRFNDQITIIGAGATGSWLALIFAKLGISGDQITVWDFDTVASHNVANQAFKNSDVGRAKTEALQERLKEELNAQIKIKTEEFKNQRVQGYVFNMVDTMSARKEIWENSIKLKPNIKLLVEPRMGLDLARIYNVNPMSLEEVRQYEDTFYEDEEAEVSACGASQTVITTSLAIASYCARQLINHVNNVELDNEILIDLKHNNLITTKW